MWKRESSRGVRKCVGVFVEIKCLCIKVVIELWSERKEFVYLVVCEEGEIFFIFIIGWWDEYVIGRLCKEN